MMISGKSRIIRLEMLVIVFIIFIFSLSAIQSIHLIFDEIEEGYQLDPLYKAQSIVNRIEDDFETMFFSYLLERRDFSKPGIIAELDYLARILKSSIYPVAYNAAQGEQAIKHFEKSFSALRMFLQQDDSLIRKQRGKGLDLVMTLDVSQNELIKVINRLNQKKYERHMRKEHMFFLFSIISMAFSGLGLILILMLKLRKLGQASIEKKETMSLLMPRMAAIEAAMDGIIITSEQGQITYANKAMASLHGYNNGDELVGKSWRTFYDEDQCEWFETEVFSELLIHWYWNGHSLGRKKDGSVFPQDISITALEDGSRVWVVRDYTEVMEYIALASKRLAAIEVAGDGIGLADPQGNITYINKALMSLHGIKKEDLKDYIGQKWERLYSAGEQEDVRDSILPLLKKNGYWKGDESVLRQDGTTVYAEFSFTRLDDGGFIGTARDITSRKKSEQEKEELQKQFFQAQKMEAIGRMAGGIAHDFNNILASILGYTEFLLEDLSQESKEHHFANQIMTGSLQAQSLVEQILAFSRQNESAMEVVDLVDSVNETGSMLKAMLPASVELKIDIHEEAAPINGNITHISQTLMNLCVNAVDAMGEEHGCLSICIDRVCSDNMGYSDMLVDKALDQDDVPPAHITDIDHNVVLLKLGKLVRAQDYVRLMVSDTGTGIPREVMEHIFEPFFTTKPVDHGTGLGLSSVHGIIVAHGGSLLVESHEGKGTKFILFFPIAEDADGRGLVSVGQQNSYDGGGRILLVEDEAPVRDVLVQMLERLGYESYACSDGDEAVDHLRENPDSYDLIISDYTMPRMNGGAMAKEIANDFPDLPVIILSGYSKRRLKNIMAENPAIKAVLRKPVKRDVLAKNIYMILQKKQKAA